jgi:hypothetical protein
VTSDARFAVFETVSVLFNRQHNLRIHEVLRDGASVRWHRVLHSGGAHYLVRESVAWSKFCSVFVTINTLSKG